MNLWQLSDTYTNINLDEDLTWKKSQNIIKKNYNFVVQKNWNIWIDEHIELFF